MGPVDKLEVFQKAYALSLEIHRLTQDFPKSEQYGGIADQLRRSSKSVCALLAEGAGRQVGRDTEFRRYCVMALGSAEESKLWLRYAADLDFLAAEKVRSLTVRCSEVARMLQGLIKHLAGK